MPPDLQPASPFDLQSIPMLNLGRIRLRNGANRIREINALSLIIVRERGMSLTIDKDYWSRKRRNIGLDWYELC